MFRAGCWLKGNTLGLQSGLSTMTLRSRLRNLSKWSRESAVMPPCSIRPLPFGDVLIVRTRKLTNEKMKKEWSKTGVSEHDANKQNKTKVKKMR